MAEALAAPPTHNLPSEGGARARAGLWSHPGVRLGLLAGIALTCMAAYLLTGLSGNHAFILGRRATTLATLVLVATAVGVSTVLFHTVTANRILTPSIMGLDALYIALQTAAVFLLGAFGASTLPTAPRFALELAAMVAF